MAEDMLMQMVNDVGEIKASIAGMRADLKTALGYGRLIDEERTKREQAHETLVARVRALEVDFAAAKVKLGAFCAGAGLVFGALASVVVKMIGG